MAVLAKLTKKRPSQTRGKLVPWDALMYALRSHVLRGGVNALRSASLSRQSQRNLSACVLVARRRPSTTTVIRVDWPDQGEHLFCPLDFSQPARRAFLPCAYELFGSLSQAQSFCRLPDSPHTSQEPGLLKDLA